MMPPAHLQARTSPEHGPILLSPPHLSGEEEQLLLKAMASNWIAPIGPDLEAFERELATRVETSEAVGLASGTAALHLALQIVGVRPGDQVLCSTFTFAASANPILYCGAKPVFIDSSEQTWNMDPNLLDAELRRMAARGRLPRAVIVVDLYGQCADYDPILSSCAEFEIPVICDAAESLGASYKGSPAGSLGEISIVSFNGNKIKHHFGVRTLNGNKRKNYFAVRSFNGNNFFKKFRKFS